MAGKIEDFRKDTTGFLTKVWQRRQDPYESKNHRLALA